MARAWFPGAVPAPLRGDNPPFEGCNMADQWFFAWDGQQFGPFSAVRLKELGGSGDMPNCLGRLFPIAYLRVLCANCKPGRLATSRSDREVRR